MTVDDESSVYVGGLSMDVTEDVLRKVFQDYGAVVAVKLFLTKEDQIICDRDSGSSLGYGFVTFTNPRAVAKAITGMDGGSIDGRTVRVNEVRNKNAKPLARQVSLRDRDRGRNARDLRTRDWNGNTRRFSPQRMRRLSPEPMRSTRGRLPNRHRSRSPEGQGPLGNSARERHEGHNSRSLSPHQNSEQDLYHLHEEQSGPSKPISRTANDRHIDMIKVRGDLDRANQRREELLYKVTSLEDELDQKEREVSELQGKMQELDDTLATATAATSQRLGQLRKLQRAFLKVKDQTERLKNSEKELQELFNGIATEANDGAAGIRNEAAVFCIAKAGLEEEGDVDIDI